MGNSLKKSSGTKEDKLYSTSESDNAKTPTKRSSKGKASETASKIKTTITNMAKPKSSDDISTQVKAMDMSAGTSGGDYGHFNQKLSIDDFDLLKVLGKGSFGKVMLVKKKSDPSGTLYALKTLRKAALLKRNQLAHTKTERTILQDIHCPFLVHLFFAFQTADKLYMVIDFMAGGELFFWLKKQSFFSENRCRLYTAEIALALEALHKENIIYRDLKPENILLDSMGHIRLADFGLAKGGITSAGPEGGTKTFCGTPEYLAPEILEDKGHGKAVDWWALGTLLYEMLTGLPPFYDKNVQRMYHMIMYSKLAFPRSDKYVISDAAKEVITRMLERKISDRLCSGPGGANELKRLAFFNTLDFNKVMSKAYKPEFVPPASRSETDVRNFDVDFTNEVAADSLVTSVMSETMRDKSNFEDFTFKNTSNLR